MGKLKVGIYGFTGCAGDQLVIIHSEDELLDFFSSAEVASFLMVQRENKDDELDIALIEGSITTLEQKEKLEKIAIRAKTIVAIGTCACFGGIQSMKLGIGGYEERFRKVYGVKKIDAVEPFESLPIDAFVKVDHYISGCPIDKKQFFRAFSRIINGTSPERLIFPVCAECKWKENDCLLNKNILCLGPITSSGCGAVCPSHNLPCVGCWGLYEEPNLYSEYRLLLEKGFKREEIINKMRNFGGKRLVDNLKEIEKR